MSKPVAAGYVVAGDFIRGCGATADAAWQTAMESLAAEGIVVLRRGETSDAEKITYTDQLEILPATSALIEDAAGDATGIREESWLVVDGVACQRYEIA